MIDRRAIVGVAFVAGAVLVTGALLFAGRGRAPAGNAIVVVNAATRGLDSIVVTADPSGAPGLAGRHGYVAPQDSARIPLAAGRGDALVRAWRDGRVVADHEAYFGGRSWFEVRIGDDDQLARYRRTQ